MIKEVHLSMGNPENIFIVIILIIISALIGVRKYRDVYKDKREVYYAQDLINTYIDKGKNLLKREVITTIIIFVIFLTLMVLFLIYNWLIWLFFALILFGTFIYAMCGLPIERFKLYNQRG